MIDIIVDEDIDEPPQLPGHDAIEGAVTTTLAAAGLNARDPDLCIRFAADAEVRRLNRQWRGQDRVTDVLSFPLQDGPEYDPGEPLGDIVLAVPFILSEAERLGLPAADHALHLIVHACLHLLGHDHAEDTEAERMQALENAIMQRLGLHSPYPDIQEEH